MLRTIVACSFPLSGFFVIASTFLEPHLPQCSRAARLRREAAFGLPNCDELTARSGCPQLPCAGHRSMIRAHVSWKGGRSRDQKESVQTDPRGGVVAVVRLRSSSQCTKRSEPVGAFRPLRSAETRADALDRRARQIWQYRTRGGRGDPSKKRVHHGRASESHRQERGRPSCPVRPTNNRGGSRTRKNLALSRWAVHRRHPALSGCADAPVRNSCVRGKER